MATGRWFRGALGRPGGRPTTPQVPSDLFVKCPNPHCGKSLYQKELEQNFKVCKHCGQHFRLTAQERLSQLLDEDSFEPYDFGLETGDPLHFPGYRQKIEKHRANSGLAEAIVAGFGRINAYPAAIAVTDFHFMAGTMNSVVGETIARTLDVAVAERLPAILVSGTGGGARTEESLLSLMQMAKTASALARFDAAGLLSICLLTDPTMAGVLASWASLGDIILAEPGATIGFTGERVAATVQTEKVPENFRTAEFNFQHGMIDRVTPRPQLKETIGKLLAVDALREVSR